MPVREAPCGALHGPGLSVLPIEILEGHHDQAGGKQGGTKLHGRDRGQPTPAGQLLGQVRPHQQGNTGHREDHGQERELGLVEAVKRGVHTSRSSIANFILWSPGSPTPRHSKQPLDHASDPRAAARIQAHSCGVRLTHPPVPPPPLPLRITALTSPPRSRDGFTVQDASSLGT